MLYTLTIGKEPLFLCGSDSKTEPLFFENADMSNVKEE